MCCEQHLFSSHLCFVAKTLISHHASLFTMPLKLTTPPPPTHCLQFHYVMPIVTNSLSLSDKVNLKASHRPIHTPRGTFGVCLHTRALLRMLFLMASLHITRRPLIIRCVGKVKLKYAPAMPSLSDNQPLM